MLRAGLVGLGSMGSAHFANYKLMAEKNEGAELVAVCDVNEAKLDSGKATEGNLVKVDRKLDLSSYTCYRDMEEMINRERLDYVDLCLPTFLHAPMSIKAMEMGVNVICEKPMARSSALCGDMIAASKRTGKKLMIGHTLRYWNAYLFAKDYVVRDVFGPCYGAYLFRGGSTPKWSWENWLLNKERAGGALLDQHIHDVDTIVWLFGLPKAVSSIGKNCIEGSGYDVVSTNYVYEDGKVINAQDDWTINGARYNFGMEFRMNFQKGALAFREGRLTVHPVDGEFFEVDLSGGNAYYDEVILFTKLLKDPATFDYIELLESHKQTIALAEAEEKSADNGGALVYL